MASAPQADPGPRRDLGAAGAPEEGQGDVASRLVAVAARLLAEGGPDAVSVRRVAAEVGASTMAVYTHFGGKAELLREVTRRGFLGLARRLAEVELTDDPVADVAAYCRGYRRAALDDPHLFAVVFGRPVPEVLSDPADLEAALETFLVLVRAVERAMDAGRFAPGDPSALATEAWTIVHGLCCIELGIGLIPPHDGPRTLASACRHLAIGAGDDPARAGASIPDPT